MGLVVLTDDVESSGILSLTPFSLLESTVVRGGTIRLSNIQAPVVLVDTGPGRKTSVGRERTESRSSRVGRLFSVTEDDLHFPDSYYNRTGPLSSGRKRFLVHRDPGDVSVGILLF